MNEEIECNGLVVRVYQLGHGQNCVTKSPRTDNGLFSSIYCFHPCLVESAFTIPF